MQTGYSGTPLAKKLGLKTGHHILFHQLPEHYFLLFEDLPEDIEVLEDIKPETADFIHIFCKSVKELKAFGEQYKHALKKTGSFWISWPKGKSKIKTDLNGNNVRRHGLEIGLVDVKVAAIDEDWSGLKFMYRIKDR